MNKESIAYIRPVADAAENSAAIVSRPDSLWTDVDLAGYLKLEPQTIANNISKRKDMPPHVKIGGKRRWIPDSVRAWVKKREIVAIADRRRRS